VQGPSPPLGHDAAGPLPSLGRGRLGPTSRPIPCRRTPLLLVLCERHAMRVEENYCCMREKIKPHGLHCMLHQACLVRYLNCHTLPNFCA
jgi:hypothetical protein